MYTKRQIVAGIYEELGLAGYVFDISPEEQQSAVLRLDSMMATWGVQGIRIGYNATVDPQEADLDQDSGLPDWAIEAVVLNGAIRMAPSFGKSLSKATTAIAKEAKDAILGRIAQPIEMQAVGNLPAGAGNRWRNRYQPFLAQPVDRLTAGPDALLEFNGPTS